MTRDLDWVVHLILGDCMHYFQERDWESFTYFRNELSLLKARQKQEKEVRNGSEAYETSSERLVTE